MPQTRTSRLLRVRRKASVRKRRDQVIEAPSYTGTSWGLLREAADRHVPYSMHSTRECTCHVTPRRIALYHRIALRRVASRRIMSCHVVLRIDNGRSSRPGLAQQGMARHGTARYGMARHCMAWHGTARYGRAPHGMAGQGKARYGRAGQGMAWHGTARHGTVRQGRAWQGRAGQCMAMPIKA